MKINVEVDCTPEEARRALGLPDVTMLHDIYLDRAAELMRSGITPDMIESMVRSWGPMGEAGMGMMQKMMGQFGGAMGGKKS